MSDSEAFKKVPLVLFSGGMDSTYMVQWLLAYGDVDTLFVEADPHPLKRAKETEARNRLFRLFEKHYPHRVLKDHQHSLVGAYSGHQRLDAIQQISWLTAALAVYDSERHEGVYIGYVLGDQAPAFRAWYETFWSSGWTITRGVLSPVPPLLFPILNHQLTKYDVIDRIDKRLVTSTWVCEMPREEGDGAHKRIKACGKCRPCRLLKHTVTDWEDIRGQNYMAEVIKAMNPELYPSSLLNELDSIVKDKIESK
jgi:hypothetical protein